MSPDEVMHPFLLTFHDKTLEDAYQEYALYRRHRAGDMRFFFVASVVVLSVAVKTAALHSWSLLPALPSFLCGLLPVVLWLIYIQSSTKQVLQLRPYMSAACRLGIAITGCVSKHSFSWMFALAPHAPFALVQYLVATETFGNAAFAFGITLNFREHLPIQILTFVIFLFGKAETACQRISESAGVTALNQFESFLDQFFEFWVSFLFSTMGSFRNDSIPKLPCLHLTTFLMTFFSMGVVSYVIWIWEHQLRIQFLNSRSPQTWHLNIKHSDNTFNCVRFFTLISLAALFWRFCIPLTNLIKWLG